MEPCGINPVRKFLPCKPETLFPNTDWDLSWSLCRQPGLSPHLSSFLWKLLLNLLCTQDKLYRMGTTPSPICKLCKVDPGTLSHELLLCPLNNNIGLKLISIIQTILPNITPESLLRLELYDLEDHLHLPVCLLISVTLSYTWKERGSNTRVQPYSIRSQLEQTINLLRTTRLAAVSEELEALYNQMFQ